RFAAELENLLAEFQGHSQALSWALVHWGLGLGVMQLLPIDYVTSNDFQKNQMNLLFQLIGIKASDHTIS
ncbi:hypothetical protein MJH12_15075, partial [bacterium]|nr:hypothetical protein [bacterium]